MSAATVFESRASGQGWSVPTLAQVHDEELVQRCATGDDDALGLLYDRLGGVALGLARRILRDEELARDAVQDAFLAVWRHSGTYDPARAKASTWVLTIVHRRAVDLVRREERRRTSPLEGVAEPESSSAEEEAGARQERARVRRALGELADSQREVLELAYYGGFTQAELAERLGVPLGTIKSRMFAGLRRLRELLEEGERALPAEERWRRRTTSTS